MNICKIFKKRKERKNCRCYYLLTCYRQMHRYLFAFLLIDWHQKKIVSVSALYWMKHHIELSKFALHSNNRFWFFMSWYDLYWQRLNDSRFTCIHLHTCHKSLIDEGVCLPRLVSIQFRQGHRRCGLEPAMTCCNLIRSYKFFLV